MLLGILFCVCLVAANLLETKVVQIWKITATAGLVVFPISYIINDCIAEVWGFRKARLIIWMGFAMNFMVVALGQLAILMPAAPFWEGEEGFNFVFGMAPRIAVASLTAFLLRNNLLHQSGIVRVVRPVAELDGNRLAGSLRRGRVSARRRRVSRSCGGVAGRSGSGFLAA